MRDLVALRFEDHHIVVFDLAWAHRGHDTPPTVKFQGVCWRPTNQFVVGAFGAVAEVYVPMDMAVNP